MAQWKTLQRSDLKAFDEDMTKAVLYAMEHGGTGRISNNGHAILRNNNGQTMSVSRSSSGGSRKQNVARDLNRLFGGPVTVTRKPVQTPKLNGHGAEALGRDVMAGTENLKCPAKGCEYLAVTQGAIYAHVDKCHYRCDECDYIGRTAQARALHVTRTHRGINPAQNRKQTPPPAVEQPAQDQPPQATDTNPPQQPETPPAAEPTVVPETPGLDDHRKLLAIRELLGEDPRITQLQERVAQQQQTIDALIRERDDVKAQLALVREAIGLS